MFGFFQFGASRFAESPEEAPVAPTIPPVQLPGGAGGFGGSLSMGFGAKKKRKRKPQNVVGRAIFQQAAAAMGSGYAEVINPISGHGSASFRPASGSGRGTHLPLLTAVGRSVMPAAHSGRGQGSVIHQPSDEDIMAIIEVLME